MRHSSYRYCGLSCAAEVQGHSGDRSQSTVSQGSPGALPWSMVENQSSSANARCLRRPPSVIAEAATLTPRSSASSPPTFHANVAR